MRILALDFGGDTGWAVGADRAEQSGTWDVRPRRGESPGMRYIHLRRRLNEVRAAFPDLRVVVYEQAHQRGGHATEYAVGCATAMQAWCAEHGLEFAPVHGSKLKKWATGKGNVGKPRMVAEAKRRGYDPRDDNEADAILLLLHAAEELSGSAVPPGVGPPWAPHG